jgi:hypothetical protein
MSARLTKVAPSLTPLQAILTSERHRRQARKWPWAWWCTACDDAYGAGRTESEAQAAADKHERALHGSQISATYLSRQTPPTEGDQVT